MSTAILVCGMHRSGTSATTGALRLAGVALGSSLLGPGEDNPKGYWENSRAVAIHEKLLAALDSSWDDIRELPAGWDRTTAAAEAAAQIHALVDSEFSDAPLWAIKDPRLCRFVPLWRRVLADRGIKCVALLVGRHPAEVAASIRKRNGWSMEVGKLLWMRYVFESERYTRDMSRAVITYESLLADPVGALWRAGDQLDVQFPIPSDADTREFGDFVDSSERHHRRELDESPGPLDVALDAAYTALAGVEAGSEEWPNFLRASASAESLLRPLSGYLTGLASMSRHWQSRLEEVEVDRATVRSDLLAQVRWSEEAVVREQGLHAALDEERSRAGANGAQLALHQELVQRVGQLLETSERAAASLAEEYGQALGSMRAERELCEQERMGLMQERRTLEEKLRMLGSLEEVTRRHESLLAEYQDYRERTQEELRAALAEHQDYRERAQEELTAALAEHHDYRERAQEELRAALAEHHDYRERAQEELRGALAEHHDYRERAQEELRAALAEHHDYRERAQEELMASHLRIQELDEEMHVLRERDLKLTRINHESEMALQAIKRSISWRMTQPGRSAMNWLRRIF